MRREREIEEKEKSENEKKKIAKSERYEKCGGGENKAEKIQK